MRPATLTTTVRRSSLAAVVALGLGAAAVVPAASVARPIGGTSSPKNCQINGGPTIRSGSRGRSGGIEYACSDGIACQVEGGRTTGRCSHAARQIVVSGSGAGAIRVQALVR